MIHIFLKTILVSTLATLSLSAFAQELPLYTKGDGQKFVLKITDTVAKPADMTLAVVESSKGRLVIETHFNMPHSMISLEMWQQFHIVPKGGKLAVDAGYMFMNQIQKPQKLDKEYLGGYDGVQMSSFLVGSKGEIDSMKVGEEEITVPAGKVKAIRYRRKGNGQTVDFWIAKEAKPFGLVKIQSTGQKMEHKYTLELKSLVKNVGRKIDPKKAEPMNALGRSFLPKLGPRLFTN